jgi:hypothetical protein
MSTFNIDFFEFSFLIEACIPPRPIARSMFWDSVINRYYHQMTDDERASVYEWVNRNPSYKDGLEKNNEQILVFEARFNPDNQYIVDIKYDGKDSQNLTFKLNDRYHTSISTSIVEQYITKITKL